MGWVFKTAGVRRMFELTSQGVATFVNPGIDLSEAVTWFVTYMVNQLLQNPTISTVARFSSKLVIVSIPLLFSDGYKFNRHLMPIKFVISRSAVQLRSSAPFPFNKLANK